MCLMPGMAFVRRWVAFLDGTLNWTHKHALTETPFNQSHGRSTAHKRSDSSLRRHVFFMLFDVFIYHTIPSALWTHLWCELKWIDVVISSKAIRFFDWIWWVSSPMRWRHARALVHVECGWDGVMIITSNVCNIVNGRICASWALNRIVDMNHHTAERRIDNTWTT